MSDRRYPSPSHNFVPEYQQSGIPFVKTQTALIGTAVRFDFDTVTRWLQIHVDGHDDNAPVRLFFNEDTAAANSAVDGNTKLFSTATGNFFEFHTGDVLPRLEVKCKSVWIAISGKDSAPVSVFAGLTSINALDFPDQTTENGFSGV